MACKPQKYDINDRDSLTPTQKRDIRVDEMKNKWALLHGIPIYRIWEDDIRNRPNDVMKNLKEIIKIHGNERFLLENKNKRQNNKIK